jgi:hypothetical protein
MADAPAAPAAPVEPASASPAPIEQLALTPELLAAALAAAPDPASPDAPRLVRVHVCRERCDLGDFHIRIPAGYLEVDEFSDGSFKLR